MMKRLTVLLVTLLSLGLLASPAAATSDTGNAHNQVAAAIECEELFGACLYDTDPYQGDWYFINVPTTASNFCINLPSTWNNRANSVTMNGPKGRSSIRLFNASNCDGTRLNPPDELISINLNSTMANNVASSARIRVW